MEASRDGKTSTPSMITTVLTLEASSYSSLMCSPSLGMPSYLVFQIAQACDTLHATSLPYRCIAALA